MTEVDGAGPRRRLVVVTTIADSAWTILRGQLRFLAEHGFDVTLISSPGPRLQAVGEREGVRVVEVPMEREISPVADLVSLVRLVRVLRRLAPDAVMTGTPKAGLLGGIAARLVRTRVRVYLMRGLRLETATGLSRRVLWWGERLSIRCAHATVAVSPSLRERARALGLLRRSRAVVLGRGASNGVDVARFDASAGESDLRERLGIPADAFVFGFVGRVSKDKGIEELLDAFTGLTGRPARLLLVGTQETAGMTPRALDAIAQNPSITSAGWLDDPAQVYRSLDVLVLPTYREGFPNVVLEAAAASRPTITTRATGAVDSVVDGVTGLLVPVRDAAALREAMQRLLDDPGVTTKLGAAAHDFVVGNFTNDIVWQNLLEFLASEIA